MKIWEQNEKNKNFYCIETKKISDTDNSDTNILLINENEIVSSSFDDKYIIFWNLKKNFSKIKKFEDIDCNYSKNSICLIHDNYLLIGGYENNKGIYLININNHETIKNIVSTLNYVCSIFELLNGTILVGAFENHKFCLINYKFVNDNLIKIKSKESAHKGEIFDIIGLEDGTIISCSDDSTIKFWN
jgi:WD40 repeat protein